jgi:hypothetical protein
MKTYMFPCALSLAALPACSSGGADGATTDALPATDAPTSPQCNEVDQRGSMVPARQVFEAAPPASGGAVQNGTYVLTALRHYVPESHRNDASAYVMKATIVIDGPRMDTVADDGEGETRETFTIDGSNSTLWVARTCFHDSTEGKATFRGSRSDPYEYTATSTTIVLMRPMPSGTVALEYTKR